MYVVQKIESKLFKIEINKTLYEYKKLICGKMSGSNTTYNTLLWCFSNVMNRNICNFYKNCITLN